MKKLIFVRHAKAEPEEKIPGLTDFERSLTPSGKRVAKQMARLLFKMESSPGLILTSPAFRAYETALIFAGEAGSVYDKVDLVSSLYYNSNTDNLLRILSGISNDIDTITLFGHNPSFTDMPDRLSGTGCGTVPKTGIVCLSFDTDKWTEVSRGSGRMEYFLKPEKTNG